MENKSESEPFQFIYVVPVRDRTSDKYDFYKMVIPGTTFGPPLCHFERCSSGEKDNQKQ